MIATEATKEVLTDRNISLSARAVFVYLELNSSGGICSIGLRRLSRVLGVGINTISRALAQLQEAGHIKADRSGADRSNYALVAKQETAAARSGKRKEAPMLGGLAVCPKCEAVIDFERDGFARKAIA